MAMWEEWLERLWPYRSPVVLLVLLVVSLVASVHALLRKRDTYGTIGWVSLIWLAPGIGSLLYLMLGINRIARKAQALVRPRYHGTSDARGKSSIPPRADVIAPLVRLVDQLCERRLVAGNRIQPLADGDAAYPEMLTAIEQATVSITLATYIFDNDPVGKKFVEALAGAHDRGVSVRVLIDAAGIRYSWHPVDRILRRRGIRVHRFMPALTVRRAAYLNLRNHRKILVVDGKIAFTGGMNIRESHIIVRRTKHPVQDLHFRLEGPVVGHLQEVFAEDWEFTCRESLRGEHWFPELVSAGETYARGIADGPDGRIDRIMMSMLGAIACAQHSISIMTPYFLPGPSLATGLKVAALRGVSVNIVLPLRSNIPMIEWATWGTLFKVLGAGCHVWMSPPPFDHTKLMVVDATWTLFGSSNMDPRSLRLNFELCVEAHDLRLGERCEDIVRSAMHKSTEVTTDDIEARGLLVQLRDGIARLFSPYL